MYCVRNGRVCIMVFDEQKNKYRFFRSHKWEKMSAEKRNQFRIDW